MTRYHNVQRLTTAELERAKRELQANLGLINPGSPAHVPIQAHMQAIDTELAERAGCRQASGDERTVTTKRPPGSPFPYCPAGREPEGEKPPARAGLDTARAGPDAFTAAGFRIAVISEPEPAPARNEEATRPGSLVDDSIRTAFPENGER